MVVSAGQDVVDCCPRVVGTSVVAGAVVSTFGVVLPPTTDVAAGVVITVEGATDRIVVSRSPFVLALMDVIPPSELVE